MNQSYSLTLIEFGRIFGLKCAYEHYPRDAPPEINYLDLWLKLTGEQNPNTQHLHETRIHHPVPKVWHLFCGLTIFGRHEPQNVRSDELLILGQYVYRTTHMYKFNVAHHMALHFRKITNTDQQNVAIYIGGLITQIAVRVAHFDVSRSEPQTGPTYLDLVYFGSLDWIRNTSGNWSQGSIRWVVTKQPRFTLPDPRTRFRPDQPHYLLLENEEGAAQ